MKRIPEPEIMGGEEQARAYAEADFTEPNKHFVELFAHYFPGSGGDAVLDLGCGPGDITRRFAHAYPGLTVHGLDGSASMLQLAEGYLADEPAIRDRVEYVPGVLPDVDLPRSSYDAVISNSLLHHLHEPQVLWEAVKRYAAPGAAVLVMDLKRPPNEGAVRDIVEAYAASEPDVLKEDFYHSLFAAFEPGEVRRQLEDAGLGTFVVEEVTDRHLAVWGWR